MADAAAKPQGKVFPQAVVDFVSKVAAEKGVPAELALGILGSETNGNLDPTRVSGKDARGLWQLRPIFVEQTGRDPGKFNYFDEVESTYAALDGIKQLYDKYKNPALIIAAYNAGPTKVDGIIEAGGSDKDLPPETQKYLRTFNEWAPGFLEKGLQEQEVPVEGIQQVAQAEAPSPTPTETPAPGSLVDRRLEELRAQSGDQDTVGASEVLSGVKTTGNLMLGMGKGMVDMATQFPREALETTGAAQGNETINEQWPTSMGPPPRIEPPLVDPTGVVNFLTLPLGMGSGRVANTAIGGAQGFYQALDAKARTQAETEGLDWNTLGFGERSSRIVDQLDWNKFDRNTAKSIAYGAFFGALGGGKRQPEGLKSDVSAVPHWLGGKASGELIRTPASSSMMTEAEKEIYQKTLSHNVAQDMAQKANAAKEAAYFERLRDKQVYNASRGISEAGVHAENQSRLAAHADEVSKIKAPYEAELAQHNAVVDAIAEKAGLPPLPKNAGQLRQHAYQQQIKGRFKQEIGLPPEDPSKPLYQNLFGDEELGTLTETAKRPVSPEIVAQANAELGKIAKEGRDQDALGALLTKLAKPLDDPKGVKPMISKIESRMAALEPSDQRWQTLNTKREELLAELVPVTVNDLENRAKALADAQRSAIFRDPANKNEARLVTKAKVVLYGSNGKSGLVERTLSPEEAATLREARTLSREYNQKDRAAEVVGKAFGDVSPGAKPLRAQLARRERLLRRTLGDERYEGLLDLARTFDDLNAKAPTPPTLPEKPELLSAADVIGPRLATPKLPKRPEFAKVEPAKELTPHDPARWHKLQALGAVLQSVVGSTSNRTLLHLGGIGTAGYVYHNNMNPHIAQTALTIVGVDVVRELLTNPVARREFKVMASHLDNMSSNEFSLALSKFATAVEVHKLHRQEAGADVQEEQQNAFNDLKMKALGQIPPTPAPQLTPPPPGLPVPTRRTGKVAAR